jgi:hypothetical protein
MTRQMAQVLLGLTLVAVLGACDAGSPSTQPSACGVPAVAPAGTYAPAAQAPGGGGLEVVDHGFTQFSDSVDAARVSLGALVRNTSSRIAYRAGIKLHITDAQGRDAVHPANARELVIEIPVVRPGEQVAVGAKVGTRDDVNLNRAPDKVTSLGVELGSATWLPADDAALFPAFAATFRGIGRDSDDSLTLGVQYSVTSTSCRQMAARGTAVVFFDSSGAVVGGTISGIGDQTHCGTQGYVKANLDDKVPAGIDEGKTLVTEYCDLARPEGGVHRPSGAPFN